MGKGEKVELCHWVVAFVDLLGQGDKMREVSQLIDSRKEDEAVGKMKDIYFSHKHFYESFHSALISNQENAFDFANPLPPHVPEEEYQAIFRQKLKMQVFSDAAMFYLPLMDNGNNLPIFGVNMLLSVLGFQMLSFLAQKRPFRCGIEVGFGVEIEDGKLIGPAVLHAYELESKRAQYPRIVVGDGLVEYLEHVATAGLKKGTPLQNQALKSLARQGSNNFRSDIDGETILDYLGADFLKELPKEETGHFISLAYKFADEEQRRHREQKNTKLAIRYKCLETYIATHIKLDR